MTIPLFTIASQLAHTRERTRIDAARENAEAALKQAIDSSHKAREDAERRLTAQLEMSQKTSAAAVEEQLKLTGRLQEETARLSELVQTLPPDTTLPLIADLLVIAVQEVLSAQEQVLSLDDSSWSSEHDAQDMIEDAIRAVLHCVAGLAKRFDGDRAEAVYHANIALFLSKEDVMAMDDKARAELHERMLFSEVPAHDLQSSSGVLVIERALSAATDATPQEVVADGGLAPLVFHVPHEKDAVVEAGTASRFRVLPGAPWAFCFCEAQTWTAFQSREDLFDWCRDRGAYSSAVMAKLREYFYSNDQGRAVRSFACVPIRAHEIDDGTASVGVLNIHCSLEGMFRSRTPTVHLLPLLQPFNAVLAALLDLRAAVQGA